MYGTFGFSGGAVAAGQKSYWERFHGDVTVDLRLHASGKKIGAWGRALQQRFWGAPRMATIAATSPRATGMSRGEKSVIFAPSLGTVFDWHEFYLYATLAPRAAKR